MKRKVFYHPELMPNDKAKILLAGVYETENSITDYNRHFTSIVSRVYLYLEKALDNEEDIFDLVEKYLKIQLAEGDDFYLAYQIVTSPQMQPMLQSALETWKSLGQRPTPERRAGKPMTDTDAGMLGLIDNAGQKRTEELIQYMTLQRFLEALSKAAQEERMSPERRVFFHPRIMPTDKMKILLGSASTKEIKTYQDHLYALAQKVRLLIAQAQENGENLPELVENYLGEYIEGGSIDTMVWQILETPQMLMVLMHAHAEWQLIDMEQELLPSTVSRAIRKDAESPEEGQQRTEELLEETTLRYFLEHLSIAYEDL